VKHQVVTNKCMFLNRREFLIAGSCAVLSSAAPGSSRMSVEAYIFQQYASRQHKKLGDVLDEAFSMTRKAGFRNIELNQEFFAPELRDRTLALLRSNNLAMPSVYVGGAMHETALADKTSQRALEIGAICKPFGCKAIVNNPDPLAGGAEKTDSDLKIETESLNRMGRVLRGEGFHLRVHHHTPEMVDNAREWRYILHHTDPKYVSLCMDLDWVHQGGQDPLTLLREAGTRVEEIHVRNSKNKLWLEAVEDGDVDYRKIAAYLEQSGLKPLIVVELAYRPNTVVTRPLEEDLRLSRIYTEKVFGVSAQA
jgi:sugar phosphate isomerase/epimerase